MSKGLGRIEQAIHAEVAKGLLVDPWTGAPGVVHVSSWNVLVEVFRVYDPAGRFCYEFTKAQRLSVTRAMHSYVRKHPRFALTGGQGRKRLFLYDTTDPKSVDWARASVAARRVVALCEVKAVLQKLAEKA
jgi:hypothetical protein